jgi:hypothetical protein
MGTCLPTQIHRPVSGIAHFKSIGFTPFLLFNLPGYHKPKWANNQFLF